MGVIKLGETPVTYTVLHTGGWQWLLTPAKPHTNVQSLGSSESPEADVQRLPSTHVAPAVAGLALCGVLCRLLLGFDLGQ